MRKLFVHIGTHRTGTTSFQAFLLENQEALRRGGVAVCTERHKGIGLTANCFDLPHAVLRRSLLTVARMTGHAGGPTLWRYAKAIRQVRRFLSDKAATSFVLSAEAFCFARDDDELAKVKRLFRARDIEVVPVVCLRAVASWRESWFAEVDDWAARCNLPHGGGSGDIRGEWYFDTAPLLRFWHEVGDVVSIDYDGAVDRDGSIIPALCRAMDFELFGDIADYRLRTRNRAPVGAIADAD